MWRIICALAALALGLTTACTPAAAPTAAPLPPTELKYKLIERFGAVSAIPTCGRPRSELDAAQLVPPARTRRGVRRAARAPQTGRRDGLLARRARLPGTQAAAVDPLEPGKDGYNFSLRTGVLGAGRTVQGTISAQGAMASPRRTA
jgi:hypothetical protein